MLGRRLRALGLQLLRRAEAAVGFALGQQPLGVLGVNVQPLRLAVRAVVALCPARLQLPGPPSQSSPSQCRSSMSWVS